LDAELSNVQIGQTIATPHRTPVGYFVARREDPSRYPPP
jgi:hypothetical protein